MPSIRRLRTLSRGDADRISRRVLKALGPEAKGRFVAIDMKTGRTYVGDTTLDAVEKGLAADSGGRFYIERLGYPVAVTLKRTR